ncbi:hypothetical protein D3C85_681040 [compost metagenome]
MAPIQTHNGLNILNIFATSSCPIQSAQEHCNTHVVKMATEVMQLLSTAHCVVDGNQVAMKQTHVNHPNAKWCRNTKQNYMWAWQHAKALCDEYTFRTGRVHASSRFLDALKQVPVGIHKEELEPFAMAMPEEFKVHGLFDQTKAYRMYLNAKFKEWTTRTERRQIVATWSNRSKPTWIED